MRLGGGEARDRVSSGRESARRQTGQSEPRLSLPPRRCRVPPEGPAPVPIRGPLLFRYLHSPPGRAPPNPPLGIIPCRRPRLIRGERPGLGSRHCPSPASRGVTPFRPRQLWRFSSADGQGRGFPDHTQKTASQNRPRRTAEGRDEHFPTPICRPSNRLPERPSKQGVEIDRRRVG